MSVCNKKYSRSINIIFVLHFMKIYAKFIDMSEKNQTSRKMKIIWKGGKFLINFGTHFVQI